METLVNIDQELFEWINTGWSNSIFDAMLPFMRKKENWFPLYGFIAILLMWKYRWQGLAVVAIAAITIVFTDQLSASVIKPLFQRLRPCNDKELFDQIQVLSKCGSGFSFVSSHATNHFGFAMIMAFIFHSSYRWVFPIGFLWAGLISLAQVYCGVHYPFDVLSGAILGSVIAFIVYLIARKVLRYFFKEASLA